ncbi:MAG: AMP-dependent synthetase/ligase [Jatrophihabitans sp.]|uniref:AMP-dependent synthetase/ligase n=1 Tax=Jatrophihabitans sp. TaxID=1932789 RepID=UPI003F802A6B
MSPATLCAAFQSTATKRPDAIAIRSSDDRVVLTWRDYAARVRRIAAGLAALGVGRGDTVGIMLTNRPEFHLVDTAAIHLGATPFSIYNTLTGGQISHLFGNAGNRVVVCEAQFLDQVTAGAAGTQVEHIVCIDEPLDGTITLDALEDAGDTGFDFDAAWRAVEPGDVLTIIYTSGTTGPPKGVELTHANMIAEVEGTNAIITPGLDDIVISYLPDAHIANRWGSHYSNLITGIQVVTVADLKQLITTLPRIRPTVFGAVPQTWYKLRAGIEAQLAAEPSKPKRQLADWALGVGKQRARLMSDRAPVPLPLRVQHELAERLVLSKVRARLGLDRVQFAATGAAAIAPEALEFVLGLGLPVCELWGMSETSCAVTVNRPGQQKVGTVGQALPNCELRIADDGELLVRGPLLMRGYRNDPEKTAETIDADGWLHTGDIASIDADGFVKIVDRKKELMINASGKNMSPANIENELRAAIPLAGPTAVIGDDRPYVVALFTLDPDAAAAFAAQHGLADGSPKSLVDDPAIRAVFEQGVKVANEKLSRVEQVKQWTILPETWEPGGPEITPTMKLKRKPIAEKYASEIESLYAR